jgi:hypothetical protein
LGQARNTQRRSHEASPEELRVVADITKLATRYGRYGYRRITALLRDRGLAGESQEGGENLETRRIEGAAETTQAGKAMA